MTTETDFIITLFDQSNERVGIQIPDSRFTDEKINLLRAIPRRSYLVESKMNLIPLASLQDFYNKADEMEFTYFLPVLVGTAIDEYMKRADYVVLIDSRHGSIVIRKNRPDSRPLYQSGIETWRHLHDAYSLSISEAYKIPMVIPRYNPTVTIDYSPEILEIFKKEAARRAELISFTTMTDAPEITDDILLTLRPFQKVAKKFALHLNGRAILAYDMGLGKTPIAISIVEGLPEIKKVLVVCPATLKTNWRREIKKSTGQDSNNLSGATPNALTLNSVFLPKHKYHIINYDILGRGDRDKETNTFVSPWAQALNLAQFDMIIFDEAHYTKNLDSGRSRASRILKSKYVLPLTGTPVVNRPSELFSLLHMVDPVNFPAYESFVNQWLTSDGKVVRNERAFREMLSAYMIRRKKEEVIKDLPQIQRIDHFIELSDNAKENYKIALEGLYISLRNPNYQKEINNVLVQIQRLKQIVSADSVQHTIQLAEDIYEESEKKVLIFSQFVESCYDISSRLGKSALVITGEDSDDSRYEKIDKFQNDPSYKYMVLSTKAGAEGLTLTAAHYVIFNDLCWTPKDHRQAEARCYGRMNDLHSATAYYIQAEGTITEMIMSLLNTKMQMIESTVDGINKDGAEGASIIGDLLNQLRMGL